MKPYFVGLTGGIACGKSTIATVFRELGVETYDADQFARDVVVPGSEGLRLLNMFFGSEIIQSDGCLDRKRLGKIAFADPDKLRLVEKILHPLIKERLEDVLKSAELRNVDIVIYENSLIVESDTVKNFDALIVAYVNPDEQISRVMKRNGFSEEEARQRLSAQAPLAQKVVLADYVIATAGTKIESQRQVCAVWQDLQRRAPRRNG